ncbi:MAG: hypothetical protein HC852_19885 [Acaryochloridaceae cyanobacterium RU_4_10]|nr:hypothetical protein [Acaryochloridaceae cyanobacterium RU_4_10]
MTPSIQIIRHPYEEPEQIHLELKVSNNCVIGICDFYANGDCFLEWAEILEKFPQYSQSVYLWEVGSERSEDKWAYYFRFRAFTTDSVGHCALQFRFNNNANLPQRKIFEFCIEAEAAAINRLGSLLRRFGQLEHCYLNWSLHEGFLSEYVPDTSTFLEEA